MVTMPARWASWGVAKATGFPKSSISPTSALCAPDKTLSSVDLPAPFSPRSAWISDGPTSRWTFSSASTPGKRLLTPVILRIGPPDIAGAGDSAAGALAIQERSLIGVLKKKTRRERRALQLYGDYFTSLRRSAVLRLSLVIATGVN